MLIEFQLNHLRDELEGQRKYLSNLFSEDNVKTFSIRETFSQLEVGERLNPQLIFLMSKIAVVLVALGRWSRNKRTSVSNSQEQWSQFINSWVPAHWELLPSTRLRSEDKFHASASCRTRTNQWSKRSSLLSVDRKSDPTIITSGESSSEERWATGSSPSSWWNNDQLADRSSSSWSLLSACIDESSPRSIPSVYNQSRSSRSDDSDDSRVRQ